MPAAAPNCHRKRGQIYFLGPRTAKIYSPQKIDPSPFAVPFALVDGLQGARLLDGEALDEVDAEIAQRLERRLVLDLLGDDLKVEGARELDHRGHHLAVHAVGL